MLRSLGILCPLFSIEGSELGPSARRFVDWLANMDVSVWQLLPIQKMGASHSPYQAISSFAGEDAYISLDEMVEMGLLESAPVFAWQNQFDVTSVMAQKAPYLHQAFEQLNDRTAFETFCAENARWLEDYVHFRLFAHLHQSDNWQEWDEEYRHWQADIDLSDFQDELDFERFVQWVFWTQWDNLHAYARQKGIQLLGDIPFYVDGQSVDVWAHQAYFDQTLVAGCPPDYFSPTGQRWGMPCYNFERMKQDHYSFWVNRLQVCANMYDGLRIDHFRALDTYWAIPVESPTALEGQWMKVDGQAILKQVKACLIAEDLGQDMSEGVDVLKQTFGIPGMQVYQFMDADEPIQKKAVYYSGTHDNVSLRIWLKERHIQKDVLEILRSILASEAELVILPVWDVLNERVILNEPGKVDAHYWTWKMDELPQLSWFKKLIHLTKRQNRQPLEA